MSRELRATSFVTIQLSKPFKEEATFGGKDQAFIQLDNGRSVHVRGKVDRIDRLKADGR